MKKRLPIVSIVFHGDIRLQVLQILSVGRLYDLESLSSYSIVVNGDLDLEGWDMLRRSVAAFPALEQVTEFFVWGDFFDEGEKVGFYDQQALKLAIGRKVGTPHYLVLDAKNHFVSKASSDNFFADGKPILEVGPASAYWVPYLKRALRALDLYDEKFFGSTISSVTPMVMDKRAVEGLSEHICKKWSRPLPAALEKSMSTEFVLYYVQLLKSGLIEEYSLQEMPKRTLFTSWPQDSDVVLKFISESGPERPVFGLHRKRLPQLIAEMKDRIKLTWRRELLYDWENADWFLTIP